LADASRPPESANGFGAALADVSDRTTLIIREEIELAKAELGDKMGKLAKAAAGGAFAGIFVVTGLLFGLHAAAWGIAKALNNQNAVWVGYLITAVAFFIIAAFITLFVVRWVKKGTPPMPKMAIDEAKLVRETLTSPEPEKTL
jgi:Putative Actinobacterial Holin-X, holin superfamily III